ncbi:MAG TPA: hypothetical protein VM187_03735, partial [Niastella sp.]|nr:hypothetical protein [Niastella sp.]
MGKFLLPLLLLLTLKVSARHTAVQGREDTTSVYSRPYIDTLNAKALRLAPAQISEAIRLSNQA